MAQLSDEERAFLTMCDVPLSRVLDATGLSRSEYQEQMRALGLWVAHGVSRCYAGHSMRTRSGHCLQCNSSRISYLRRFDESGRVYVAHSVTGKLVKIGSARDAYERVYSLSTHGYGGCWDWTCVEQFTCRAAGRVEHLAQKKLRRYARGGVHHVAGQQRACYELFSCSPSTATRAIERVLAELASNNEVQD
jgi:hypothetical protein